MQLRKCFLAPVHVFAHWWKIWFGWKLFQQHRFSFSLPARSWSGLSILESRKDGDCGRSEFTAFINSRFFTENLLSISEIALSRICSNDLFRNILGSLEESESVWPTELRTTLSERCLFSVRFLFWPGISDLKSNWSHEGSVLMSFKACREALMTSLAVHQFTVLPWNTAFAGFKTPKYFLQGNRQFWRSCVFLTAPSSQMLLFWYPWVQYCCVKPLREWPKHPPYSLQDFVTSQWLVHLISSSLLRQGTS